MPAEIKIDANFCPDEPTWVSDYWKVLTNVPRHYASTYNYKYPVVDKIIYNLKNPNKPSTIVYWKDGSKTVVTCADGEPFSKEMGLSMAIIRKIYPNRNQFKRLIESGTEQLSKGK